MKHKKDEIWVCSHCKTANYSSEGNCIYCAELPNESCRTPYLPSSSVKELVDIIKKAMSDSIPGDLVDVPPSYTERYWFLYKQLETALKQFEEEK